MISSVLNMKEERELKGYVMISTVGQDLSNRSDRFYLTGRIGFISPVGQVLSVVYKTEYTYREYLQSPLHEYFTEIKRFCKTLITSGDQVLEKLLASCSRSRARIFVLIFNIFWGQYTVLIFMGEL